jgi:hypothetical protein
MRRPTAAVLRRGHASFSRPLGSFSEPLESRLLLATYTVTNVADVGAGSFRQGILSASTGSVGAIDFLIARRGKRRALPSPLPLP